MDNLTTRGNLIGIGLMVLAMLGFAIEDSFIKVLSGGLPVGQVLIMIGIGGTTVFYLLARASGHRFDRAIITHPWVIGRTISELFGTAFFVLSLALVPIVLVSAIIQVSPLIVTLGAALILGEKVGIRRWSAIGVGLVGVFIVLRPWDTAFDPAVIFCLLGVVCLSARDIATRRVPKESSTLILATFGFGATIPAGSFLLLFDGAVSMPGQFEITLVLLSVVVGVAAYYCIITSMRVGEVSAVVPFRYSRLVFGAALGLMYFGESLDKWTIIGSVIVVTSGLYSLWREARVKAKA